MIWLAPFAVIFANILFGRFHFRSDHIKVPVNEAGDFITTISVNGIRNGEVQVGERRIPLLLSSITDTLFLSLDCATTSSLPAFKGALALENQFLNNRPFPNYYERFRKLSLTERKDPIFVDSIFNKEELEELSLLEQIQNGITQVNFQFLKKEITYYYLILKMRAGLEVGAQSLEQYQSNWHSRNEILISEIDCQPTNSFGTNYNHLIGTWYDHLQTEFYLGLRENPTYWVDKFEVSSMDALMELLRKDGYNKKYDVLAADQMCDQAFEKGLSNRIYRAVEDGDFENLRYLYQRFQERFPTSTYLERLAQKMKSIEEDFQRTERAVENIHFYPTDIEMNSLDELLKRKEFANKVILIDIWGTWCGPCREEFPYLAELKDQLKDQEVVYLYLANEKTANPEAHWQQTAKYYNLSGYHYLLNKAVLADFWDKVNPGSPRRSYPTYVIVGKDGLVKVPKASKPSAADDLYKQILEVLNNE